MTLPMLLAYPDRELMLVDLLTPLAPTVTWISPEFEVEDKLIHVQRIGGGPDEWDVTDYALMRVAFYAQTRNEAWALAGQGEGLILAHRGRAVDVPGAPTRGLLIDYAALDVGGLFEPDLDPDDRRVIKNFTIGSRRQAVAV